MVLKYTNKTNFILLDGFARVCTVSTNFPDNPRICIMKINMHYESLIIIMHDIQNISRETFKQTIVFAFFLLLLLLFLGIDTITPFMYNLR